MRFEVSRIQPRQWVFLALAAVVLGWLLYSYLKKTFPRLGEASFDPRNAMGVVHDILNRRLIPAPDGSVVLPSGMLVGQRLGRAYVTEKSQGLVLIFFPTWRDLDGPVRGGFLYCSRPLTLRDKDPRFYGGEAILGRSHESDDAIPLDKPIGQNWYHAYFRSDYIR